MWPDKKKSILRSRYKHDQKSWKKLVKQIGEFVNNLKNVE